MMTVKMRRLNLARGSHTHKINNISTPIELIELKEVYLRESLSRRLLVDCMVFPMSQVPCASGEIRYWYSSSGETKDSVENEQGREVFDP